MTEATSVVHLHRQPYDVLIDRTTPWGNPFTHLDGPTKAKFRVATRGAAIDAFEEWVLESNDPEAVWIREHAHELRGKRLGCWCEPKRCHGSVLAALADGKLFPKPKQQALDLS